MYAPCRSGPLNMSCSTLSHKRRQGAYKAIAYVLKGGGAQRHVGMTKVIPPQFSGTELLCQLLKAWCSALRQGHAVAYVPQVFGLHSGEASHCIKGNHLLAFHHLADCVRESGTTRQGHMDSWPHLLHDCRRVSGFRSQPRLHECLTHQSDNSVLTMCVLSRQL